MKAFAIIVAIIGLAITAYAGLFYPVSIPAEYGEREIINIGLQQNQLMAFQFGLALMLMGVGLYGTGVVQELLLDHRNLRVADQNIDADAVADFEEPGFADPGIVLPDDIQALMDSHGIMYADGKYVYGPYRYERLEDALAYARQQRQ